MIIYIIRVLSQDSWLFIMSKSFEVKIAGEVLIKHSQYKKALQQH